MSQNKTAVIDADGVYLGMVDETLPIEEGHRRIYGITECDLPPLQYVWADDTNNNYGGAFWPIPKKLILKPGVK